MNPCEDCHRPVGVHCCHNCKKDANKCKEYHANWMTKIVAAVAYWNGSNSLRRIDYEQT